MMCPSCSRIIPDGSENCPYCKSGIDKDILRCPSCWAKLHPGVKICTKCGCDVDKTISEMEEREKAGKVTLADKIKKLPLWFKIVVPVLVIAIIAGVCIYSLNLKNKRTLQAVELAEDYIVSVDIATARITKLAQVYKDMVYDQSWLDHTGSAHAVRDVYSQEISNVEKARVPLSYTREEIEKTGVENISKKVNAVYKNYTRCYGYVIGEKGTYKNYMTGYKKLLKEYEESLDKLRKEINNYK